MNKLAHCLLLTLTLSCGKYLGAVQAQNDALHRSYQINKLAQSVLSHEGKQPLHNLMLFGVNARDGFSVHIGKGITGRSEDPISKDHQFKIASITKTFVATVILQLIEEGKLDFTDPISRYITDLPFLHFEQFLIHNGKSVSKDITIIHCLQHISGVPDIFTDEETRFVLSVLLHKKRQYNVEKVVKRYYKYRLNEKAHSLPGEGYHYSDMNYMLLGFVTEQLTGKSLAKNIRERILEPLNMKHTYFEYYEPECGIGKQVDTYLNRLNITKKVNTSYEWGGGGLVSTVQDLGIFVQALFANDLFQNKETLTKMLDIQTTSQFGKEAGMGIFRYQFGDLTFYGHGGFYGSLMLYCPSKQVSLVINIGQANAAIDEVSLVSDFAHLIAGD